MSVHWPAFAAVLVVHLMASCSRPEVPTPEAFCSEIEDYVGDWPTTGSCDQPDDDCFRVGCVSSYITDTNYCYSESPFPDENSADATLESLSSAAESCQDAGGVWNMENCDNDTGASGVLDLVVSCTEQVKL